MKSDRFDEWSRDRARRLTRRQALGSAGLGGLGLAISHLWSGGPVRAQTGEPVTCRLMLEAVTSLGPATGTEYSVLLDLTIAADGAVDSGSFTSASGQTVAVTGQTNGRSIDLSIAMPDGGILTLTGVGDQEVSSCWGNALGYFSGPGGDLGTWTLSAEGSTEAGGEQPGGSGNSDGSSGGGSSGTGPEPTPATNCPQPSFPCGPNCCPAGGTCTDGVAGFCACPGGTEQCGLSCVPSCAEGFLDLNTCQCVLPPEPEPEPEPEPACVPEGGGCANHGQCCTGYCGGGTCFTCGGRVCGEYGCIDPMIDNLNCGNCGTVCVSPQTCIGGVCQ